MAKRKNPVGRSKRTDKDNTKAPSAERGTIPGDKRKTYIVNAKLANKVEAIAEQDQTSVKMVVHVAFKNYINVWEKKNGPLEDG